MVKCVKGIEYDVVTEAYQLFYSFEFSLCNVLVSAFEFVGVGCNCSLRP